MKSVFFLILIQLGVTVYSQTPGDYISPQEYIDKGIALHDSGKYEEAIKYYEMVNYNDSLYMTSLVEKALSLQMHEKYDESINICQKGLKIDSTTFPNLYGIMGSSYDEIGKPDSAIIIFKKGIELFPYNYLLYFNLGITYERQGKVTEAIENYQKTLMLNPSHQGSHLQLAKIAASEGAYAQAILSYNTYLLFNPTGDKALSNLIELDNLVSDNTKHESKGYLKSGEKYFNDINMLIENHVALNDGYKIDFDFNFPCLKQNQLLLSQIKYTDNSDDFWMRFYVPFYMKIYNEKKFRDFAGYLMASSSNEKIKKYIDKNLNKLLEYQKWALDAWVNLHKNQSDFMEGKNDKLQYWWNNYVLEAIGNTDANNNKIGLWKYFYNGGRIQATGLYDNVGNQTGEWKYYYPNGILSKVLNFGNGKINGPFKTFDNQGSLTSDGQYKDDYFEGIVTNYYPSGDMKEVNTYNAGVLDGEYLSYYQNNKPEYKLFYKNNLLSDTAWQYFANGVVQLKALFKDGKNDGSYLSYYANGRLYDSAQYINGSLTGEYKYFYSNGNLLTKGVINPDDKSRSVKSYYRNGKIKEEYLLDESGNPVGIKKRYNPNGTLLCEYEFKNSLLYGIKYYDYKGNIQYSAQQVKNNLNFKSYYPDGVQESEGLMVNGVKQGKWKYFDRDGNISKEENYIRGDLDGISNSFYANGALEEVIPYKDGRINGFYVSYYPDGTVEEKGYYVDNEYQGEWTGYLSDGTLSLSTYYSRGIITGMQKVFAVNGKLDRELFYSDGKVIQENCYDSTGILISKCILPSGSGKFQLSYYKNEKYNQGNMLNGVFEGPFLGNCGPNVPEVTGEYVNNQRNGEWIWYYENGNIRYKGLFLLGNTTGTWTSYTREGKVESIYNYFDNNIDGECKVLDDKGEVSQIINYTDGLQDGTIYYYSPGKSLKYVKYYDQGKLIGYSYAGTGNIIGDTIPVKNETAKLVAYYGDSHNKSIEYSLENGWYTGPLMIYYPNGKIWESITYVNNDEDGLSKEYYENGNLKSEKNYFHGNLQGQSIYYYPDGKIRKIVNYMQGDKHGMQREYSSTGDITSQTLYYNGEIVSSK